MNRPLGTLLLALALAAAALAACKTGAPAAAPAPAAAQPAGLDAALVDRTASPCDDFYQYACGGWLKSFQLPPDKGRWTRGFSDIEERNQVRLRELAEAAAAGQADPGDRYAGKVGDFYAACMDEAGVEARGREDLAAAWRELDAVADPATLARAVGGLHRAGVDALFGIGSWQAAQDATQVVGVVFQGGLSLPDRDFYLKDDPHTVTIQRDLRAHVARMLELAGVPAAAAAADAEAVFALERSLAEAHWTRTELRDPHRIHNRLDLPGLQRATPRFPWPRYLESVGHPGLTAFEASTPQFLERLEALLGTTPAATWRAYLRWHVLDELARARALPRAFVEEQFAFESKSFTGAQALEPRWKHCLRLTDRALGEALGQAFVRRFFGEDGKQKSAEIISGIEGAMARDLDALPWMDGPTRAQAHAKLGRVVNKVGYPARWRSYDALAVDRGSLYRSLRAADAFELDRQLHKVGRPVDREEWIMSPPTVNAYYEPSLNEMVFPAGILQNPFFTRGAPDAVNYGAIGMVMGHELTHGYDDEGRQYDAQGNLRDWWTAEAGHEFERRARCVKEQYDGYVAIDEVKLNGQLTLGENLADLGGLKLALAAYQASRAGKAPEAPVAGFTPEQAFFIGYAQSWCAAQRPEFTRLRAVTDPHSPPWWRVNGPLSNLPAFARAFGCQAGSRMVRPPEDRCEVW